jgi:hypothetical protein
MPQGDFPAGFVQIPGIAVEIHSQSTRNTLILAESDASLEA